MRRRVIIASLVAAFALCIGLIAFVQAPASAGKFPRQFSDSEKLQIVSAAHSDALKQTLIEIRRGQFHEAWHWILNSRKQTVRSIGQQGDGKICVTFGIDEPGATDGYAIWARYILAKEKGRWIIDKGPF